MTEYPKPEPRIVIADYLTADEPGVVGDKIVAAIDRLTEQVERLANIIALNMPSETT